MFKSNVEVEQTVLQPMASAGGSVKKVKVSVVKEEPTTTTAEFRGPTAEPAFTLPSDSKIID